MQSDAKLKWIQACSFGWFISILVILALSSLFDAAGIENLQFYLGIGMGAGVGFMQWRRLKAVAGIDNRWVWFSVIGLGTPFLVFDIVKRAMMMLEGPYYIIASVLLAGLLVGILQYTLLRHISRKAAIWIPASFAGWLLAVLTVLSLDYTSMISHNKLAQFFMNLALILAGGFVLGIATNGSMRKIMTSRRA